MKKFLQKHDFELNIFRFVRFWIKIFSSCQLSNWIFYNVSDFKSIWFQRVSFAIKKFTTRQIWKRNNLPESTTCTFHIVVLDITMYSYRLQYLPQLDNSTRHQSNNSFCTLFRKDFHFWFSLGCPTFFSEFTWYMQKQVAANSKTATISTAESSHMSD